LNDHPQRHPRISFDLSEYQACTRISAIASLFK
jgi:hypothetical protein